MQRTQQHNWSGPRPTIRSQYDLIARRIRVLLRGKCDIRYEIRCRGNTIATVDIESVGRVLSGVQIEEINRLKEVIQQEFPARFAPHTALVGTKRLQLHIPLL